jgi:hypothetical protein
MVNYLCKSNKTTYKAILLLFIFALVTKASSVYRFMLLKNIRSKPESTFAPFMHQPAERTLFFRITTGLGLLLLLFNGCAKVGAPTGGLKDLDPPVYLEGSPENRSINFNGKDIEITFNEYIQLKDQNKELMISPPLKKRPIVRIRDKSIRVILNNELLPQTTYTVNFGNSISDINEGNILPDFEFVFSTGNTIDSLSVIGKALNAFDKKPSKEEVLVMLYENLADSAPLLEIPRYIGKAGRSGLFSINNIRADTFRILALIDANNNRIYDPGIESVGFLDSLLIISPGNVKPVTFIRDTVKIIHPATKAGRTGKKAVAQKADTTIAPGKKLNALDVSLVYFQEESSKVFLDTRNRETREKLYFTFTRPPHDEVKITPVNFKPDHDWFIKEASRRSDTLTYWITDTLIARQDTLRFSLAYSTTDSAGHFVERTDTITLKYQKVEEKTNAARKGRSAAVTVQKLSLGLASSIANRGVQDLNKPIIFSSARPLGNVNPGNIELYRTEDSLAVKQPFTVIQDTFDIRAFKIKSEWQEDLQYKLLLKPGVVSDIYGLTNDSLELTFATQKADYYGRILVNIDSEHFPLLLQLMDDKEKLMDQKIVTQAGVTVFDYLTPRKYILKAVYDENKNMRWDTGSYLKKIQPEKVYYHIMTDAVRSNWDHEVTWIIAD